VSVDVEEGLITVKFFSTKVRQCPEAEEISCVSRHKTVAAVKTVFREDLLRNDLQTGILEMKSVGHVVSSSGIQGLFQLEGVEKFGVVVGLPDFLK